MKPSAFWFMLASPVPYTTFFIRLSVPPNCVQFPGYIVLIHTSLAYVVPATWNDCRSHLHGELPGHCESLTENGTQGGINHNSDLPFLLRCTLTCWLLLPLIHPHACHPKIVNYSTPGSYLCVFSLNTETGPEWAVNRYVLDEWMSKEMKTSLQ